MSFWGVVVKPGKPHAFVPPPEEWNLHLSQAAIAPTVPEGQRVALAVASDSKEEPLIVCTLTAGRTDTAVLDLFFSQYSEFSVIGEHAVHLSGYYTPPQLVDEDDEDEDEDDEDGEYQPGALGFPIRGSRGDGDGDDDDDEDDEDEDDDDDDDDDLDGLDEDEEEDDENEDSMDMDGDEDDEMFGYEAVLKRAKRKPHVVIEDITDQGQEAVAAEGNKKAEKGGKKDAKAANKATAPKGKEKAKEDDEDEEDEEEEDEDDDEEEDEEEEAEEEEDTPAPKNAGKRPAEASKPSANGVAKADGPAAKKQAVGQQQQPTPQPVATGKETKDMQKQKQQNDKAQKQDQKQEVKKDAKPAEKKQVEKKDAEKELKPGKKNIRRHPNGFEIEDVSFGNPHGKLAKPGQKVLVRYTGRLKSNGKVFDKSGQKPFQFRLGVGEVIKGWDLGVEGMRVGDKRRLVIPPQLAYGAAGVKGTIPSNSTLEFDVELVDVK